MTINKIQIIDNLIEEIREKSIERKADFTPSVLIWQFMNEIADDVFLDKMIRRLEKYLSFQKEWIEDEKIIVLDDYRK